MGLHWSTPRVMGVSYSTRIGVRKGPASTVIGGLVLCALLWVLVVQFWYAILALLPLLAVLAWSIQWMNRQQRIAAMNHRPPNQSQASVSNRR